VREPHRRQHERLPNRLERAEMLALPQYDRADADLSSLGQYRSSTSAAATTRRISKVCVAGTRALSKSSSVMTTYGSFAYW